MKKIGVVQFQASRDKAANLKKILEYIGEAAGAGAVSCAFPEFMMFYTDSRQTPRELARLAEGMDGEFVGSISDAARKNSIGVIGTLYESSPVKNRVYDTAFVLDSRGRLLSSYRKVHLYDALGFRESSKLAAGNRMPEPARTRLGTVGTMICYDLRFPEMARGLAAMGTDVLVAPSAWVRGEMKEQHWLAINQTRAVENGCYVVAPDQVGNIYCGRSLVVDPFGRILLDMKKRRGLGFAGISQDVLRRTRAALPLRRGRRDDVYGSAGRK